MPKITHVAHKFSSLAVPRGYAQHSIHPLALFRAKSRSSHALTDLELARFFSDTSRTEKSRQYYGMEAAHIAQNRLGGLTIRLLFGEDEESRGYTIRNGLLLHPTVESFFDDGSITIVPASDSPDETELVVRVLEQDEKWLDRDFDRLPLSQDPGHVIKNRDLHERRLVFLKANRPAKRFLYFMYCIALYKAQTEKRQAELHSELARSRRVWATAGVIIRKNMLRALAAILGHELAPLLHVEANSVAEDPAESRAEKVQAYNEVWEGIEDSE